ncbi:MAG: hypothetical protein JNL74_21400 [Fibrobacteres bacterium]|nr:hypothetical protein [Fibrobacterota bacterium]
MNKTIKLRHLFLLLIILIPQVIGAQSAFTFVKHILNDTLGRDTVFHRGSTSNPTQAVVNLVAKSGSGGREGLNILIVSDFSASMQQNAQDTAAAKIFLLRNAVRRFIDANLKNDDALSLMRFIYGYQFFPERETRYKPASIWYRVRVEAGGRLVLRDTLYSPEGCRRFISQKITNYYSNCDETYNIAAKLAGRDMYGQVWGRDRNGNVVDSLKIDGVGYVLDSVLNDSVIYVQGNPPLNSNASLTFNYIGTNTGRLGPRDEVYSDTFHFVPGSLKGAANEFFIGQRYGQNMFSINTQTTFGIERIWWEFCHSGYSGVSPLGQDTGTNYNILEPWKADFSWIDYDNSHLQRRLSGGNTAVFYNMWQAVRYALTHNDKAAAPVVIFLTDGTDEASPSAFRNHGTNYPTNYYPFPLPRHFSAIPSDTSYGYLRTQFESFMRDSIGSRVSLYTIILDTFPGRPDYQTLWRSSNLSSTVDKKHFHLLAGSDLDSVYNLIGKEIRVSVARPILNQPMFVDMLNKVDGARYVAGSLQPGPSNLINFDSIKVDSTGDNYIFRFYSQALDAYQSFDYFYRVEADITAPSLTPKRIVLNPDPLFSRAQYYNTSSVLTTDIFNTDTLYVKSTIDRLLLSRSPAVLDTAGIGSGSRILSYSILADAVDTSINLYSLLRLTGSNNSQTLLPVNTSWTFNPLAWLDNGSRSISDASSSNVTPYVKITYEPNGVNDQAYDLRSRYQNPQTGAWMDAQLSYLASGNTVDFYDSVVIAVGTPIASNITNIYSVSGTVEELSLRPPVTFHVLGRSRNTGRYDTLTGNWTVLSGLTKYPAIIGDVNGKVSRNVQFSISPDMASPLSQSDSGYVRVSYVNVLGQAKSYQIFVRIIDNTDRTSANSVAVFLASDYLPNQNNSAALESLFVNYYDVPLRSFTKAPLDTVLEVYALLFSKRSGFRPKYKGLDTVDSWTVRPGVSVTPPTGSASSLTYTNHFAPRVDTIEVTSSIDSTRRIIVTWSYGTGRVLSLESRAGRQNDNVAGRIIGKDVSLLDQHISTDTVYASLRDEFGNFISYNDTIEWRIINSGYSSYVDFTQTNPSIITKVQNGQQEYTMTATIPSGSSVVGTGGTLSTSLRDTLRVNLSASGFDNMRAVITGGQTFTSCGNTYQEYVAPATSEVVCVRAGDAQSDSLFPSFTAYIHKIGQAGILPSGWEQASQGIKWYYTNYAPFAVTADTAPLYNVATRRIKPRYHIAGLIDTMIAEWYYNNTYYRDTVRFRTLPPYPANCVIDMPNTLTAGESAAVVISFIDHNNQPVTDPSVLPSNVSLLASNTSLQFRGSSGWISGLDSVFAQTEGISFTSGVSTNYIRSTKTSDSLVFTISIARRPGDTVVVTKTIKVVPAAAHSLQIKYRTPAVDCVADTMEVSALSGRLFPYRLYVAYLLDVYGNRIQGSSVNSLVWKATGTLDTSVGVFSPSFDQLEYNAKGLKQTASGNIVCRYNSSIADSFPLNVYASVNVTSLSTHEWYADVNNTDPIDASRLTINNVLAVLRPGVTYSSDSSRLLALDSLGYKTYRDGYLDYLNISFSSPVRLSLSSIDSIFTDGADTLRKYWHVKKYKYGHNALNPLFDSVMINAIVPNDGTNDYALSSAHSHYRIWLKPTPLLRSSFRSSEKRSEWSRAMETGLKPRIAFNDAVVKSLNASWVKIGTGERYATDTIFVTDSAAPLVSRVIFTDNVCADQPTLNYTDIYFSEPLKAGQDFSDWRNKLWFTDVRVDSRGNTVLDSFFLKDDTIVSGFEARTDLGSSHVLESGAGGGNSLVYVRLTLAATSRAALYLSATGPRIRFALSGSSPFRDRALELDGLVSPSVEVAIVSSANANMSSCRTIGITQVGMPASLSFDSYDKDGTPKYPWWGAVLVNPLPNAPYDDVKDRKVRLTATIYDVLGNLVASPDFHKCLHVEMSWDEAFKEDGSNGYSATKLIGYTYLTRNVYSKGITPCGVVLAWNCHNNKGRVVAPGGYLIRIVVDNSVNQTVSTSKLIITGNK